MHIEVTCEDGARTESDRVLLERAVIVALSRFSHRIQRVEVELGPHEMAGGVAHRRCRITVTGPLGRGGTTTCAATTEASAVAGALRAVERELAHAAPPPERERSRRSPPKERRSQAAAPHVRRWVVTHRARSALAPVSKESLAG